MLPIVIGANRTVRDQDGDTIRVAGKTFCLVGFDAPETYQARCASEREHGHPRDVPTAPAHRRRRA
jgi:hypothetical protein